MVIAEIMKICNISVIMNMDILLYEFLTFHIAIRDKKNFFPLVKLFMILYIFFKKKTFFNAIFENCNDYLSIRSWTLVNFRTHIETIKYMIWV